LSTKLNDIDVDVLRGSIVQGFSGLVCGLGLCFYANDPN